MSFLQGFTCIILELLPCKPPVFAIPVDLTALCMSSWTRFPCCWRCLRFSKRYFLIFTREITKIREKAMKADTIQINASHSEKKCRFVNLLFLSLSHHLAQVPRHVRKLEELKAVEKYTCSPSGTYYSSIFQQPTLETLYREIIASHLQYSKQVMDHIKTNNKKDFVYKYYIQTKCELSKVIVLFKLPLNFGQFLFFRMECLLNLTRFWACKIRPVELL